MSKQLSMERLVTLLCGGPVEISRKTERLAVEKCGANYLSSFPTEALNELVDKKRTSSGLGKRFETRRTDILLHVCTHAQFTTAQVINMFHHLGCETFPETMLISLARRKLSS